MAQAIEERTWLLSIALDRPFRGRGHGRWAIQEACRLLKETSDARRLVAEVLAGNLMARRLFQEAGFVEKEMAQAGGLNIVRFEFDLGRPLGQ